MVEGADSEHLQNIANVAEKYKTSINLENIKLSDVNK